MNNRPAKVLQRTKSLDKNPLKYEYLRRARILRECQGKRAIKNTSTVRKAAEMGEKCISLVERKIVQ